MRIGRRLVYCWAAALSVLATIPTLAAAATTYRIVVQAQPQRLPAGSAEPCAVTAQITDTLGAPAPDGTPVVFITTLGAITPETVEVSGGLVRAELRSPTAGTAQVSLLVAGQRETVTVEFTGASRAPRRTLTRPPTVEISGNYVAYAPDYDCIIATGKARAHLGALVVAAGDLQYEVGKGQLRAQHGIRVTRGTESLEGDRLCYRVNPGQGVLLRASDGIEQVTFSGEDLRQAAPEAAAAADFAPVDTADAGTWIVARSAVVVPRERIQFRDAAVYVGSRRIVSLPHYVAPLQGQRGLLDQVFSFS